MSSEVKGGRMQAVADTPSANWRSFLAAKGEDAMKRKPEARKKKPRARLQGNSAHTDNGQAEEEKANKLTRIVALDCEMVGVEDTRKHMLARVSLVNRYGECIYDKYVQPTEPVLDYRTWVSGIRPHHLRDAHDFELVRQEVSEILRGRLVVGHALQNDFTSLLLRPVKRYIRDTAKFSLFKKLTNTRFPSLRLLANRILGITIQEGEHSSVEDAKVALKLYLTYRKEWEQQIKTRRHRKATVPQQSG